MIHISKLFKTKIDAWEKLGLHLLYLPPYSPELNPIQMLWREMKYEWMDLNVLDSFDNFLNHIKNMLNLFGSEYDINFLRHLRRGIKRYFCKDCDNTKTSNRLTCAKILHI